VKQRMTGKKLLPALLIAVMILGLLPAVAAAETTTLAGNDVVDRGAGPDSWTNFCLVDRNNGFSQDSIMTGFSVYVDRTSPFHFMVYQEVTEGWQVLYDSGLQTPTTLGVYTKSITPLWIPAGSFVGLYYPTNGAVPYTKNEPAFEYDVLTNVVLFTDNNAGNVVNFLNSGDRVYSIAALGWVAMPADHDLTGRWHMSAWLGATEYKHTL